MKILITGCAGFIGFHLTKKLIDKGISVVGLDNLNRYYDVDLKKSRLNILRKNSLKNKFYFYKIDIYDNKSLNKLFKKFNFDIVIHLAAQAGVRYSIKNPSEYVKSNLVGFFNILQNCKDKKIKHLLMASSSSVYGANKKLPYKENHRTDNPIQFYAATKKSNEIMAHSYSHLYGLPITCMRFFTVYGPWGRPDMAYYKMTDKIYNNKFIELYNKGNHKRSFTYIDDVVNSIVKLIKKKPTKEKNSKKRFQILNIGNDKSVDLKKLLNIIEKNLEKKSKKKLLPLQLGDIKDTKANIDLLKKITVSKFKVNLHEGMFRFIVWYLNYKKNKV